MAGHARVLVMDDEEIMRQTLEAVLEALGHEAVLAGDGARAVELYRQAREQGRPFDAVILDLTVPQGMGGMEALDRLLLEDPGVRAIASSGYSDDPVLSRHREYRFRGAIAKPYTVEELDAALRHVLEERTA